ncbi:MAG: hypothetical protein LBF04_02190 [Prevotellaceae bacterium]|jgi:hypothetical protein|nr:hypothetical protein [Prevotellaceae bacterium]
MDLEKFLEKYLPDFQAKIVEIRERYGDEEYYSAADINAIAGLVANLYFPEALQNFADRICEAQRESCDYEFSKTDGWIPCYNVIRAKQPKIEELLTKE